MSTGKRCGILAKTALMFPFYCIMYLIAPESKIGQLMRKPFVKFLVHASSYLFFLCKFYFDNSTKLIIYRSEEKFLRIN